LYEDGKLQKIEALYLAKKTQIERKQVYKDFVPQLSRSFYLLFQLLDYNPRLAEAIDYLFEHVLLPEDTLTIMTPMKNYTLSKQAFLSRWTFDPKKSFSKELQSIIKKDTKIGSSHYRSLLRNLRMLVRSLSVGDRGAQSNIMFELESDISSTLSSPYLLLSRYKTTLQTMEELRVVDEKIFIKFAESLKKQKGQKNVLFFYQREFRPEIHPNVINQMMSVYQDRPNITSDLHDLFQFYQRHVTLDSNKIKQAFADSSILFNFIFMNKEPGNISGIYMREQSEDIFSAFSEIAKATGGVVDTSQDPAYAFKKAIEISESYYLLYYSPTDYEKDGKFKRIKVKTKDKDYLVTHRLGYFADRD